jgi:lipopolysaccharide/colanic/teichoic acid biosynthesis glycosyltransferase
MRLTWLEIVMDFTIALAAIIIFLPAFIIISIALGFERAGPIIFVQRRIGQHGATFVLYKFRSMHVDGDQIFADHLDSNPDAAAEWARDHKLQRDPRVTPLGSFLRRSSLDELPQLFNVLFGHMSIVGPRPIVEAEAPKYGRFFRYYCSVRPGITGLWQISGRNNVSYRRRVAMDAIYARKKTILLDMKIIAATIPAVLSRTGSY